MVERLACKSNPRMSLPNLALVILCISLLISDASSHLILSNLVLCNRICYHQPTPVRSVTAIHRQTCAVVYGHRIVKSNARVKPAKRNHLDGLRLWQVPPTSPDLLLENLPFPYRRLDHSHPVSYCHLCLPHVLVHTTTASSTGKLSRTTAICTLSSARTNETEDKHDTNRPILPGVFFSLRSTDPKDAFDILLSRGPSTISSQVAALLHNGDQIAHY